MIENLDKIKNYVYILLGQEQSEKLDLQIEMLVDEVLAYCYREDIPEEMEKPVADVIATELKAKGSFGSFEGQVQSYSEGDMSVSFATSTTASTGTKFNGKIERFKLIRGLM